MRDYDDWKTTEPPDDYYCARHEFVYAVNCPHCVCEEADRQHDDRKEIRGLLYYKGKL